MMDMKDRGKPTDNLDSKGYRAGDPLLVIRMKAMVTGRTDEALNARFGISYNTWRKLIAGQPVRASLLSRLEARLDKLENQCDR